MNNIVKFLRKGRTDTPTPKFSETECRTLGVSINQIVLTDKPHLAYFNCVVAKNDNQNSRSEIHKMHSRILRGFFYARNLVHCATMTDCVGEPLASALGSPHSLCCGNANPAQSVTSQFALKVTVSNSHKETAHV